MSVSPLALSITLSIFISRAVSIPYPLLISAVVVPILRILASLPSRRRRSYS